METGQRGLLMVHAQLRVTPVEQIQMGNKSEQGTVLIPDLSGEDYSVWVLTLNHSRALLL